MTDLARLQELLARIEALSPLPWFQDDDGYVVDRPGMESAADYRVLIDCGPVEVARVVAEAVNALPELLDASKRAADAIAERDTALGKLSTFEPAFDHLEVEIEAVEAERDAAIARAEVFEKDAHEQAERGSRAISDLNIATFERDDARREIAVVNAESELRRHGLVAKEETSKALEAERNSLAAQLATSEANAAAMRGEFLSFIERARQMAVAAIREDKALDPHQINVALSPWDANKISVAKSRDPK